MSPCFASSEPVTYDNVLLRATTSSVNTHFGEQDSSWTQATLPVKHSGLGIQSTVQLAPFAFLASAAASSNLVHQILPDNLRGTTYTSREEAMAAWRQCSDLNPPPPPPPPSSKDLGLPQVLAIAGSLLEKAPDTQSRAHLLAASNKDSRHG